MGGRWAGLRLSHVVAHLRASAAAPSTAASNLPTTSASVRVKEEAHQPASAILLLRSVWGAVGASASSHGFKVMLPAPVSGIALCVLLPPYSLTVLIRLVVPCV